MVPMHFMPDSAGVIRDMSSDNAKSIPNVEPLMHGDGSGGARLADRHVLLGAERVRAALAGLHPGMQRWSDWGRRRPIYGMVSNMTYVEPEGTLSFLAASMICRKMSNPKLTGLFAYTEATYAERVLERVVMHRDGGKEGRDRIKSICKEVLGATPDTMPKGGLPIYRLPFVTYMKHTTGLGRKWKLINQTVHDGLVHIDGGTLTRLLRDSITAYIRERIKNMPEPPINAPADIVEWCTSRTEKTDGGGGDMPPCVEQCIAKMNAGENLQHNGRFLLATFSIHAGMDDASIAAFFEGAPDYSAKTTTYHIGQIRERGYYVPSCQKIASNGLCPGCDATHPTKYKKPAK